MRRETGTLNAVQCELMSDVLHSFGETRICVTGHSMLPAILPGDVLLVGRQRLNEVVSGDIVLFTQNERLFTHRVVGENRQGDIPFWVTRGDSLRANDPPVFAHELLGRVLAIVRGESRIDPRASLSRRSQWLSIVLRHSRLLGKCVMWLLSRRRVFAEEQHA